MVAGAAEVVVEGAGHAGVQGETVLADDADARVHVVRGVAGEVVALARERGGHVHPALRGTPGVELPERLVGRPARGVEVVHDVDDVVLHALEAPDRLLELAPRAAVLQAHLEDALQPADLVRGEHGGRPEHRALERAPAVRRAAEQRVLTNGDSVQSHFAEAGRESAERPARDARRVRRDDEQANALAAGAGRYDEMRRLHGVRDVELHAAEGVAVSGALGGHLHVVALPAVLGLGDGDGEDCVAARDGGQVCCLLLGGAAFLQRKRREDARREVRAGHRASAELLEQDTCVAERAANAAVLLRHEAAEQAGRRERGPALRHVRGSGVDGDERFLGEVAAQQALDGGLQHALLFVQEQVHR